MILLLATLLSLNAPDTPVAPPVFGAAPMNVRELDVASDGRAFVTVWSTEKRIEIAHVDSNGLAIRTDHIDGTTPDIDVTNDGYLVTHTIGDTLMVSRVNSDGTVLGSNAIGTGRGALASIGTRAAVFNDKGDVIIVDASGVVLRRVAMSMQTSFPSIGASDSSFLLTWHAGETLYARAIDADGEWLSTPVIISTGAYRGQSIAWNGSFFVVGWSFYSSSIHARFITREGNLRSSEFALNDLLPNNVFIIANGHDFQLLYARDYEVVTRTLSPSGEWSSERRAIAPTVQYFWRQYRPHVARSAAGTFFVWIDERTTSSNLQRVVGLLEERNVTSLLSYGLAERSNPVIAPIGATFATAWFERGDHLAARIRVGNEIRTLAETAVETSPPIIVSSGDRALVFVLPERSPPSGALIDEHGEIIRRTDINGVGKLYAAAWNGSEYVVLSFGGSIKGMWLAGARISAGGDVLDPQSHMLTPGSRTPFFAPSLVWLGDEWLLVYELENEIRTQRLSRNLDRIGDTMVIGEGHLPSAAKNGDATLIVYYRDGALRANLMNAELTLIENVAGIALPSVIAYRDGFVIAAGKDIISVSRDGLVTPLPSLPDGVVSSVLATNGGDVVAAYERNGDVYLRTVIDVPRRRVARH